jgi:hypothetical protein
MVYMSTWRQIRQLICTWFQADMSKIEQAMALQNYCVKKRKYHVTANFGADSNNPLGSSSS